MAAVFGLLVVQVQEFQQGIQPPVDAGDVKNQREDKTHAERQITNERLFLGMENIEVIKCDENEEDGKNIDWKIPGAPVLAACLLQQPLASLRSAKFYLRQDFPLFNRQFSDFAFGEHGV